MEPNQVPYPFATLRQALVDLLRTDEDKLKAGEAAKDAYARIEDDAQDLARCWDPELHHLMVSSAKDAAVVFDQLWTARRRVESAERMAQSYWDATHAPSVDEMPSKPSSMRPIARALAWAALGAAQEDQREEALRAYQREEEQRAEARKDAHLLILTQAGPGSAEVQQ